MTHRRFPRALLAAAILASLGLSAGFRAAARAQDAREPYFATVDVRRDGTASRAQGVVFDDADRNGRLDPGERGVEGVKVSNGLDVVLTDADGRYTLPARADMTVFVIQPEGWRVPTDAHWIPQFAYQHKPAGSPEPLRYGGIEPTGDLPSAINFPLAPSGVGADFNCAILGDVQVYSNDEIGFARDSLVRDLLRRGRERTDCLFALGDVVGDDLGMIPRTAEVLGVVGAPQWWVQGNHDYDSDADSDADSSDTWRRLYGPNYYAFEMGDTIFVALDNVVYPCGLEDNADGTRGYCTEIPTKTYNGRIPAEQMTFVENLMAVTDPDRLVVFGAHIPFVGFDNRHSTQHQTDRVGELYDLVEGRPALSLTGHSHTLENFAPGDSFAGWRDSVGVNTLPFRHVVTGAVAGDWWGGDIDVYGIPLSVMGEGSPRGFIDMGVSGTDYTLDYRATGMDEETAMWLSVNTPAFRDWARTIQAWRDMPREERDPVPPLSIQDLPDVKLLTPEDLEAGSWLTANVWMGDTTTEVRVSIDGGEPVPMTRVQQARGEDGLGSWEATDPTIAMRHFSVTRQAIESRSGAPEAQGFIQGRQDRLGPVLPQPQGSVGQDNMHVWRYRLPEDLADGMHVAEVTASRDRGESARDVIVFERRQVRPPRTFRWQAWNAFDDGLAPFGEAQQGEP